MSTTDEAAGTREPRTLRTDLERARHEALVRTIGARLPAFSVDELRVFDRLFDRVLRGRVDYGPLDLARDDRDFGAEAADELTDTLFYLCARDVAANDRRLERLRCEAADEIASLHDQRARANLVNAALAELRANAPAPRAHDWPGPYDLGGESGVE